MRRSVITRAVSAGALALLLAPAVAGSPVRALDRSASTFAGTTRLAVYFLCGEHLVRVDMRVPATRSVAALAMRKLLAGPTSRTFFTAIPPGTALRGISIRQGVARVDLSRRFESGGGTLSMSMRLAQVVYTMTQFRTVRGVTFALQGKPVTVFSGEGIILDHALDRSDFREFAPR